MTDAPAVKLAEAARLLGVPPRRLQYLREQGTLIPTGGGGGGRGKHSLYTVDDLMRASLMGALDRLDVDELTGLLLASDLGERVALALGSGVEVVVDSDALRSTVTRSVDSGPE